MTNGRTEQQGAEIRNCGLDALVHGWVISESAGHKKPAPEISVQRAITHVLQAGPSTHAAARGSR
ncbi:hypothetical protein ACIOG8_38105 [Streptomyces erythrochromogenes]|uniref:hypothetical protein n=1 Tax=Streptomyces erythrochromogenes TaxID=285574 RepID=UPI0037FF9D80